MIELLRKIILVRGKDRIAMVRLFQYEVWDRMEIIENELMDNVFRNLAYDLDFCSTDEEIDREIKSALQQIGNISNLPATGASM